MTCTEVREALDALLDGELDAGEELSVRSHLDWCSDCRLELEDLRSWHGSLASALAEENLRPSPTERRRTADAVIAAVRRAPLPVARWAALLAVGLSVGFVACAVALSRPPREQVARLVEEIRQRDCRDAQLRAMSAEIEQDLGVARKAVAGRGAEDPAARVVAVGSFNIARRMGSDPAAELQRAPDIAKVLSRLQDSHRPSECVSITCTTNGSTVSLTQLSDGRIIIAAPGLRLEVPSMEDLITGHADLCRRFAITGHDGFLSVGDTAAGTDFAGRLHLLLRTGAWDEAAEWEAYRGWVATRAPNPREIERRMKAHRDRCRLPLKMDAAPPSPADVEVLMRGVKSLTRTELERVQGRIETEMKKLEARLKEAGEMRDRARGLRIFAEEAARE